MVCIEEIINGIQDKDKHLTKIADILTLTRYRFEQLRKEIKPYENDINRQGAKYPEFRIGKAIENLANLKKDDIPELERYYDVIDKNVIQDLEKARNLLLDRGQENIAEIITNFIGDDKHIGDYKKLKIAFDYHAAILKGYAEEETDINNTLHQLTLKLSTPVKEELNIGFKEKYSGWKLVTNTNKGSFSDAFLNPLLDFIDYVKATSKKEIYIRTHRIFVSGFSKELQGKYFSNYNLDDPFGMVLVSDVSFSTLEDLKEVSKEDLQKKGINLSRLEKFDGIYNMYAKQGDTNNGLYICLYFPLILNGKPINGKTNGH